MTRIETARRNVRLARYAIAVSAAAGLAAFAAAARVSHPGTHNSTRSGAATDADTSSSVFQSSDDFFGDDSSSSSIGPSGSAAPQIQSGGS